MQAFILAGGLGTRLRAVVSDKPKPMASVQAGSNSQSKPFLEYQLEFLIRHGIRRFVFCVGYLRQEIQDYFGDGSHWGVTIHYSVEEQLLGTGGALKHAEPYVDGSFLVLNGDSFFNLDLAGLVRFHELHKSRTGRGNYLGSLALAEVEDARHYGSVRLAENDQILDFAEKPAEPGIAVNGTSRINAGVYLLEPEILGFIPAGRKVSIEREVFPAVLSQGGVLGGYFAAGFFVDIGTPVGYHRFRNYLREGIL